MATLFLFFLGAAFGSFLNVVALRYDPDKFLFSNKVIGGRSQCPKCKRTLRWFELIPILSFIVQRGRCLRCHDAISPRYLLVEIICGLIVIMVPMRLGIPFFAALLFPHYLVILSLWILVFLLLFLMTLIDIRLMLIPDELNLLLALTGIALILFHGFDDLVGQSFLGLYGFFLGGELNIWQSHIGAAIVASLFFAALVFITRGRGMGVGDVKLGGALGIVFGWPDTAFLIVIGFIVGGIFGAGAIARGQKTMQSAVPFGPFLALAALLLFFFGDQAIEWYFNVFIANRI